MKKIFKKFGLSLAALACVVCAGLGIAFSTSKSAPEAKAATLPASDYYIGGAGVRLVNDANGAGLRFHTNLLPEAYEDITASGTLIIPEVRFDGELTLDDLNNAANSRPVHIVTKDEATGKDLWYDMTIVDSETGESVEFKRSTVYLYDIPERSYGARMVAVSYVTCTDGSTVYTSNDPKVSMSDVANMVKNGGDNYSDADKARVESFIVDEVTVKYSMPDGSVQSETVAYGSKLSGPTYNANTYAISSLTDNYGNQINLSQYAATLPVTLDVALVTLPSDNVVTAQLIKDGYGATNEMRAFVNGSTATTVTEGIPEGYDTVLRLDWYQNSTNLWKAGSNPLYRTLYNQTDISGYDRVTFGFKLETDGDAVVQIYPLHGSKTAAGVIQNEWLFVELVQTSANVWTLTVTDEAGSVVYTKDGVTRNNSGLNDVDSIASLVFPACKWDNSSPAILLQPCSDVSMTASVYTTEVHGYTESQHMPSAEAITLISPVFDGSPRNWNWIQPSDVTADIPVGFDTVNAYESFTADNDEWLLAGNTRPSGYSYWASSALNQGEYNASDLSFYEEVWFAIKLENARLVFVSLGLNDIAGTTGNATDWIYFHLTQNDDATWTVEVTYKGSLYATGTNQVGSNLRTLLYDGGYSSTDGAAFLIYQCNSTPIYIHSTEVRGIFKGIDGPSSSIGGSGTVTTTPKDIPENAVTVRNFVWQDDQYVKGAKTWTINSADAPEGYANVFEHDWEDGRDAEYTYCFDKSVDVTAYSDLYVATKFINGSHIYVWSNSAGAHYTGAEWLYVHYHQESTGVWSYEVQSADGAYSAACTKTISAATIQALFSGIIYGYRTDTTTDARSYFTELRGIPVDDTLWGDRVIWSAVDGAAYSDVHMAKPAGFEKIYQLEGFTKNSFATMDLSNTIYEEIRFGMIANKDIGFAKGYNYTVSGETEERPTTTIMYNTNSYPSMYLVNLTKNDDGSWHVNMNIKRWAAAPSSGGSSVQTTDPFNADVTGDSLNEIFSQIFNTWGTITLYCTEVRGTHTCAYNITKSLGNGYLQDYCICGRAIGDPVEFAHGIDPEATEANDSIWRDNNYALSTPDQVAPVGFNNIEMYRWNLNSVIVNGVPYGSTVKDMPLTCLDEADVSAYDEVWFAMKNVGGTGFYVRGSSKYEGEDWLYFHLVKVDDAWTLSLISPDGYVAENVQTGIVGNTLKDILSYNAKSDAKPWDGGAYPTKADGDTTTDVKIYFTEILGITGCEHSEFSYVSNGDNTHNKVCDSCGKVMEANINCAGGTATCTEAAVCTVCGTSYGAPLGHKNTTWSWGKETCGVCGEIVDRAETVAPSAIVDSDANTHLTPSNNAAGVTAPAGFSSVTNFFSASGNTWSGKILASADFAQATLDAFSEVWFAIAIQNGHFTNTADGWKNLDLDSQLVWIKFHMVQTSTDVWTVSIYVADTLYKTFENRPGDTIYELIENNNNGLRLVIYQLTDGTNSIADTNVYATEVLGVFNTGISEYATNVWDHIWQTYYFEGSEAAEGVWSDEAAPEGFSKVSEFTWAGKDFNSKFNHFNNSDISGYSDIWFAMKSPDTTNAPIYIQGTTAYAGGDWLYVHYHQNNDGTWNKSFRSADGYFNNTTQVNLTGTKITEMISWTSGVNKGSYPTGDSTAAVSTTAYFTNVIGVLKCDGTNHSEDKVVANGDGTHDVVCRCGTVVSDNAACSGGEATCSKQANCALCGGAYGDMLDHTAGGVECNNDGTHDVYCGTCGTTMETVNCSGGEATCKAAATCSTCGGSYGDLADHTGGEATCTEAAVCTVCGTSYGEKLDHDIVTEEGRHVGTCNNCGQTVLDTGIPEYATQIWAHAWNSYYFEGGTSVEGTYSTVAAPDGYSKVSEYTWTGTDFPKSGHLNNTDVSKYSDLYFAMKVVNGRDIYVQGIDGQSYTGGNWLYIHLHQETSGLWTKEYRTIDGFTATITGLTGYNYSMDYTKKTYTQTSTYPSLAWMLMYVPYSYTLGENTTATVATGTYPRGDGSTAATAYFTDVIGVLKCDGTNHTQDQFVSNGDNTHDVVCRCGTVVSENVACAGGEATCTEAAVCSTCGGSYGEALGHSGSWTSNNEYYCNRCDTTFGQVNTSLDQQTSALFTNASSITANEATPLSIDLSDATALNVSSVDSVTLNGDIYTATLADNVLTLNVIPRDIFGKCTLEATVTIEGKQFTITAPVLVVTNMITTDAGMQNMRVILRGADLAKADEYGAIGGKGGEATMNGDGYYMLGSDVTLTQNGGSEKHFYVFGTKHVPFVGTFDGNGYSIKNFMMTNWFSSWTLQDNYKTESQSSTTYGTYLQGSLFGVLNGKVKNVAITNATLGIFGNFVHSGTGIVEDVYVEIANLQNNANTYVPCFFARGEIGAGTLRNVVFNFNNHSSSLVTSGSTSTHYPSATGKVYTAENVAVYGFDTSWINANGRGNVYLNAAGEFTDGSADNIYVEYADAEKSTNGAVFLKIALSDDIWKIVDGIPYLKNMEVSGTESAPSESNDAVQPEGGVEYSLVWTDSVVGSYESAQFIKNTTESAFGADSKIGANIANLNELDTTKQIIVGSYETYAKYVSETLTAELVTGATNYGVYNVGSTIFVLSDTEEGLMYAAKELCRRLYGWNQLTYLAYDSEAIVLNSVTEIDATLIGTYTTQFAFEQRNPGNDTGLSTVEKQDFGFTPGAPYVQLVSMHNSMNYFGITSSDEEASHADTTAMTAWSTWDTDTYSGITVDYAYSTGDGVNYSNNKDDKLQLCYLAHGDQTTFNAMVEHVVKIIKGKKAAVPQMRVINFMLEDNRGYCVCSACSQFSNPAITQTIFMNAVQERLNADGVGVGVEYFAYNAFSPAPVLSSTDVTNLTSIQGTLGLSGDVIGTTTFTYDAPVYDDGSKLAVQSGTYYASATATVMKSVEGARLWWTSHEANHSFELEHVANAHMYLALQAWIASMGPENIDVFMYEASYRNYFFPLNTWEYQVAWYQSLNRLGVNSYMFNLGDVHNNADKQTAFSAFKTYIDSRAQADVNVTFEQLKQEFFGYTEDASGNRKYNGKGYYGAGGEDMLSYFEELVAVYESHKQGGTAQFVKTSEFTNNKNTLGTTGNGYIATWYLNYYDSSDNPNYYAYARQGFFNGSYGWNLNALLFGKANTASTITPTTDVFKYGSLTQQATLEQWYTYCANALTAVSGEDAKYTNRIKLEQLLPEYMYLAYYTKYKSSITYVSITSTYRDNGVTPTAPTASTVITTSYQDLYDKVVDLGMLKPSEFYAFTDKGDYTWVAKSNGSNYYLYENMFMNWGVTAS